MLQCTASYWIPMLWERGKLDELTFWGGEITAISHSPLPPLPHPHNQRAVYLHTLAVLLKPKAAWASVSLPLPKAWYLPFNFTWPAEAIKGKGNCPALYSESLLAHPHSGG